MRYFTLMLVASSLLKLRSPWPSGCSFADPAAPRRSAAGFILTRQGQNGARFSFRISVHFNKIISFYSVF